MLAQLKRKKKCFIDNKSESSTKIKMQLVHAVEWLIGMRVFKRAHDAVASVPHTK